MFTHRVSAFLYIFAVSKYFEIGYVTFRLLLGLLMLMVKALMLLRAMVPPLLCNHHRMHTLQHSS